MHVFGLADSGRLGDRIAGKRQHAAQRRAADTLEWPMLARRRHDGPPAPGCASLGESHLREAALHFAGFDLRADNVKRVILEDPQPDPFAGRIEAVLA